MRQTKELTITEILYYLYFGLLLFAKGIGLYDGQAVFRVFLIAGLSCMAVKLCISRYQVKELIIIAAILSLTGLSYLVSGDKGMLLYGLLIVGMKDVPIKRVFKVGLAVWSAAFGGLLLYFLLRLDHSPFVVHDKLGMGHMFRWGLGYSHPNVLHISYFILAVLIIYQLGKKISWKALLGLFGGNCLVFCYSISYTGFVIVLLLLVGTFYVTRRTRLSVIERILVGGVLPVCTVISLTVPVWLAEDNQLFRLLDKVLNNRLNLVRHFLVAENISLFGTKLETIVTALYTMDNAYVFALIAYGIVLAAVLFGLYAVLLYRYGKEQRNIEIVIVLCILIAGLTEPFLFNTSFKNLSFLFIGEMLFRNSKGSRAIKTWKVIWPDLLRRVEYTWQTYRKRLLLISLLAGLLAGGLVFWAGRFPEGYIVPRVLCDSVPDEFHYIDEAEESRYQDYKILRNEDRDPTVLMEYLSGHIVIIERFRSFLGTGILIFSLCLITVTAATMIKTKGSIHEEK